MSLFLNLRDLPAKACAFLLAAGGLCVAARAGQAPLLVQTSQVFLVMAANLTGNSQLYESSQIRILQALKPDIVAIQEFNYGSSSSNDIRSFVTAAFGLGFHYFRESGVAENYSIPNGVVSRFPIIQAGTWDDVTIPDRGFAWARIQLPGTNELYVVSVHLKASSGYSSQRATEAANLKALIETRFPPQAWVVLAGDLNTGSRNEAALSTFRTFLSDSPIPTDQAGDPDTNNGRDKPYDYVLPSFSMTNRQVPVPLAGQSITNGLIFDSRCFEPLSSLPPVQTSDSGDGQHMAVLKSFKVTYQTTNWVEIPSARLSLTSKSVLQWKGPSNLVYSVMAGSDLTFSNWLSLGAATSATTNYSFAVTNPAGPLQFFRVQYP